jgi:hypothetical protein
VKYQIGDKVRVKATNRVGEVISTKHELFIKNGVVTENKIYNVNFGSYLNDTHREDQIELYDVFDDKFEIGLINLLIDVNLSKRNYEMIKYLYDLKQKYTKGDDK